MVEFLLVFLGIVLGFCISTGVRILITKSLQKELDEILKEAQAELHEMYADAGHLKIIEAARQ